MYAPQARDLAMVGSAYRRDSEIIREREWKREKEREDGRGKETHRANAQRRYETPAWSMCTFHPPQPTAQLRAPSCVIQTFSFVEIYYYDPQTSRTEIHVEMAIIFD